MLLSRSAGRGILLPQTSTFDPDRSAVQPVAKTTGDTQDHSPSYKIANPAAQAVLSGH